MVATFYSSSEDYKIRHARSCQNPQFHIADVAVASSNAENKKSVFVIFINKCVVPCISVQMIRLVSGKTNYKKMNPGLNIQIKEAICELGTIKSQYKIKVILLR